MDETERKAEECCQVIKLMLLDQDEPQYHTMSIEEIKEAVYLSYSRYDEERDNWNLFEMKLLDGYKGVTNKKPKRQVQNYISQYYRSIGRSTYSITDLANENLIHIFKYLDRKTILNSSSLVCHQFYELSIIDQIWSNLITSKERIEYNFDTYLKNSIRKQLINFNKEKFENMEFTKKMEQKKKTQERNCIILYAIFLIVFPISCIFGTFLMTLSMDEIISNEIGTYYWLFSWILFGIISLPSFYGILIFFLKVIWFSTRKEVEFVDETVYIRGVEFLMCSSSWNWTLFMFLIGGLKYIFFPDLEILSYFAILGYILAGISFKAIPLSMFIAMKNSEQFKNRITRSFVIALFLLIIISYLSIMTFFFLLFAKFDGFEFCLNVPYSVIFIFFYIPLICLIIEISILCMKDIATEPSMFFISVVAALFVFSIFSILLSPIFIFGLLLGSVLDSFILQSSFPFIGVWGLADGIAIVFMSCCICAFLLGAYSSFGDNHKFERY